MSPRKRGRLTYVRWLRTYRGSTPQQLKNRLLYALRYELTAKSARCVAAQRGTMPFGGALFGLVVDISKSERVVRYRGDAWTFPDKNGDWRVDRNSDVETVRPTSSLCPTTSWYGEFDEVVCVPHFVGMVVANNASEEVVNLAKFACRVFGIPFLGRINAIKK